MNIIIQITLGILVILWSYYVLRIALIGIRIHTKTTKRKKHIKEKKMKYKDLIEILQPFADEEVNVHTYKDCAIFHGKRDVIVGIDVIRKTMDIIWHKDGLPSRNSQDSRFSNQCLLCMAGGRFEIGYYSFELNVWFFFDGTGEAIEAAPKCWVELVEPKD